MEFKVGDRVKYIGKGSLEGKKGTVKKIENFEPFFNAVEFDKKIICGHDCGNLCKDGYGWMCTKNHLELINNTDTIIIYRNDNTVTALNKSTKEKGIAKCNPTDTFDLYTGSRLALDRLFGKEIPQVREVRRKAKKGEWVKAVNADSVPVNDDGVPAYKNGDILHIISDFGYGYVRFREGADRNDVNYILAPFEYVVLENYTPLEEAKEPVKETFYNGKVVCVDADWLGDIYTTGKIYQFVDGNAKTDGGVPFRVLPFRSFEEFQASSSAKWLEIKE